MATFNAIGKAPGVYIQEINVAGPIAGVATSTAVFVGPARRGAMNKPTFLTNWSQFVNQFGVSSPTDPFGPYLPGPPVYVTHAVRGFFDNGGTHCYFVRVGTAARAWLALLDQEAAPQATLVVTAKDEGVSGNGIKIAVQAVSLVAAVNVAKVGPAVALASAAQNDNKVILAAAADIAKFFPGDMVHLEEGPNHQDVKITALSSATKTLTVDAPLTAAYTAAGTIRIADLQAKQTRLRLDDVSKIETGSYITITQTPGGGGAATTENVVVASVQQANNVINLVTGLKNSYGMAPADTAVVLKTLEFTLLVTPTGPSPAVETYANLAMDPGHSHYFGTVIDSPTVDVKFADPPSPGVPPLNLPAIIAVPGSSLAHGADDDVSAIQAKHYKTGIDTLEAKEDVNILCIPDRTDQDVQSYLIAHCEKMQDRFAILDPQRNALPFNGIQTQRSSLNSLSGYAALYYPWISISNPLADGQLLVPPSGHIAGIYSRVDDLRGVHKAPANESIRGALALERELTDADQGTLNDVGINVIRRFPDIGILVWGARTIAPPSRTQWRYLNVRRLVIYLEKSIQIGTQFAVFEPNDLSLRKKIERMVTEFLTRVWRSGALFGATAQEAFRVRADEELNPQDVRALGQLIVEVIVVPTVPAEFIVFQIVQDPTGASLREK